MRFRQVAPLPRNDSVEDESRTDAFVCFTDQMATEIERFVPGKYAPDGCVIRIALQSGSGFEPHPAIGNRIVEANDVISGQFGIPVTTSSRAGGNDAKNVTPAESHRPYSSVISFFLWT